MILTIKGSPTEITAVINSINKDPPPAADIRLPISFIDNIKPAINAKVTSEIHQLSRR